MSQGAVRYARQGQVAYLTFDRPERRNAMTWTMYEQLYQGCEAIDSDPEVRVAVLRGAGGKAFIAGTDIAQFLEFESADDGVAYEARIERIVQRLEAVKRPTVAVVEGYAVGGGLTIAAACDIRLCTPDAKFGIPVARTLGNCLSMANYSRLLTLIGASQAKNLLLGAGFLSAEEARSAGLVRQVLPAEEIDRAVEELTEQLASHAPITMQATKEAIRRLTLSGLPDGSDLVRATYGSSDFKEGVAAFVEKRKPRWSGKTAELNQVPAAGVQAWIAGVNGKEPDIAEDAFVTPSAVVVGDVTIGSASSVWYGSVLRGDDAPIRIGADCNVQDGCVLHADPGFPLLIHDRVSLGHGAIVHGATLEDDVLIGMNAVVLNGARIGSGSVVAAGAVVRPGTEVPAGSLVAGVPAKVRREATQEDREMIAHAAASYKAKSALHRQVRFPTVG
jgi:enoyl-CoA hydratase/carnithine racemase/carbonic anhydrase/acetyltransferase-like protein (isoleucine patch superfamily)